jgi:hypothetical protein
MVQDKAKATSPSNTATLLVALGYLFVARLHEIGVFLLESLDATSAVNELLFAREERMTGRTDFQMNLFFRRARHERFAAGAFDRDKIVFGMTFLFHNNYCLLCA